MSEVIARENGIEFEIVHHISIKGAKDGGDFASIIVEDSINASVTKSTTRSSRKDSERHSLNESSTSTLAKAAL